WVAAGQSVHAAKPRALPARRRRTRAAGARTDRPVSGDPLLVPRRKKHRLRGDRPFAPAGGISTGHRGRRAEAVSDRRSVAGGDIAGRPDDPRQRCERALAVLPSVRRWTAGREGPDASRRSRLLGWWRGVRPTGHRRPGE